MESANDAKLEGADKIAEALELLSSETRDLVAPSSIHTINHIPKPIEFLREWVKPNVPLLIKGGASDWPAIAKWSPKYLSNALGDKKVSVAVTPTGYADAIASRNRGGSQEDFFMLPEERTMTIADLFAKLERTSTFADDAVRDSQGVFYLQQQDSNLSKHLAELLPDIDATLPWACEAFGAQPSAVNLWVGDSQSVTSLHKDPFENIYCVVSGWKDFILLPPTDRPWLPYKIFPVAQYKETAPGVFDTQLTDDEGSPHNHVPWIDLDPLAPDLARNPDYAMAHPLHVRVEAGDLLYLPSLWFHHVRQSDACIAVNLWYDMTMDIKFVYFQFLEHITRTYRSEPDPGSLLAIDDL